MCTIRKAAAVFAIVFFLPITVYSQVKISSALIQQDTSSSHADTLGLTAGRPAQLFDQPQKSPTLAILLSLVPGGGQVYTERYLHVPVIWGLGYHLVRQWKKGDDLYRDFGEQYALSVAQDTINHTGSNQLKYIRDFYHDERDRFGLYIGILYVLNLVDAYVGASLYSFEVSDELGRSAAVRFRIPVR